MTSSLSSRLRLLLDSAPLSNVDPTILAEQEDAISAWQLDVGQELAAENVPIAHVVLVVEEPVTPAAMPGIFRHRRCCR